MMQFDEQRPLNEIFENMDDYDLCEIVNKNSSQYTNEALEIAVAEYERRKKQRPKIDITAQKNRKKHTLEFKKMRKEEADYFFYRHFRLRLFFAVAFLLLILILVSTR